MALNPDFAKSPEATYCGRDNIVLPDDTNLIASTRLDKVVSATAVAAVVTKTDSEATAKAARAALDHMGGITGTPKRGKG